MSETDRRPGAIDGTDPDELAEVLRQHPVSLALAYGSRVTGEADASSDLDVAVRFEEALEEEERLSLLDRLTVELEDAAGVEQVDIVDLDRVGPHRAHEALRTGVLLVGDASEREGAQAEALLKKLDFDRVKQTWREGLSDRIEGGDYGRA